MGSYDNVSVFIIGGGSGIGYATVEQYLNAGANVYVFDRNITMWEEKKHTFPDSSLFYYEGDVRNKQDLEQAITDAAKKINGIDIFVYSAGIFPDQNVLAMEEAEWDEVMDVNLRGAFLSSKLIAKSMIENNTKGHIVTISSGSYRSARIGSAHYCASKAALVMFTKVLALELAEHQIAVNSLAPGLVDHPVLSDDYKELFRRKIPMGRIGDPNDIAKSILLLTSPQNTYMTGQVIQVDGGLSAGQYELPFSNK